MKSPSTAFLILLLSAAMAANADSGELSNSSPGAIKTPGDLHFSGGDVFSSDYPGTHCTRVSSSKTKERLGVICVVATSELIRDMGIVAYDSLSEGSRPKGRPQSGLLVSTTMKQYELKPYLSGPRPVFSAVVDCDTAGDAIYRATSICHVAVTPLDGQKVSYSSFVLKDNVQKTLKMQPQQIKALWLQLVQR
jgi:hypothetical protein